MTNLTLTELQKSILLNNFQESFNEIKSFIASESKTCIQLMSNDTVIIDSISLTRHLFVSHSTNIKIKSFILYPYVFVLTKKYNFSQKELCKIFDYDSINYFYENYLEFFDSDPITFIHYYSNNNSIDLTTDVEALLENI